jgi:hypothetical protein
VFFGAAKIDAEIHILGEVTQSRRFGDQIGNQISSTRLQKILNSVHPNFIGKAGEKFYVQISFAKVVRSRCHLGSFGSLQGSGFSK